MLDKKYKIHILISFLILVALGSYYLGKLSTYTEKQGIETVQEYRSFGDLSIKDFKKKIGEDYILIDVRTPGEVVNGYIEGMDKNIDYYSNDFKSKIEKLDKTKKYLIYCHSGNRSGNTLYLMKNLGFKDVHDLTGGISAWERVGEKIVK